MSHPSDWSHPQMRIIWSMAIKSWGSDYCFRLSRVRVCNVSIYWLEWEWSLLAMWCWDSLHWEERIKLSCDKWVSFESQVPQIWPQQLLSHVTHLIAAVIVQCVDRWRVWLVQWQHPVLAPHPAKHHGHHPLLPHPGAGQSMSPRGSSALLWRPGGLGRRHQLLGVSDGHWPVHWQRHGPHHCGLHLLQSLHHQSPLSHHLHVHLVLI